MYHYNDTKYERKTVTREELETTLENSFRDYTLYGFEKKEHVLEYYRGLIPKILNGSADAWIVFADRILGWGYHAVKLSDFKKIE